MRLLTLARDLGRRKAREREGLFVVEGIRACEELARSGLRVVGVLAAPQLGEGERGTALRRAFTERGVEVTDVNDREFRSAAETESPQGVLAVAAVRETPPLTDLLSSHPAEAGVSVRLLVLDAVQDPGNVGTLVRTAAALEVTATVALPGTVDLWNAKVVRSAMGAQFHHNTLHASWDEVRDSCALHEVELWGAEGGGVEIATLRPPARCALVMGNEGGGLSPHVRAALVHTVGIRIHPVVESLNVAVAAGILLHHLRP